MDGLTVEDCLKNFEQLSGLVANGATDQVKQDARQWLHMNKIIFNLLTEKLDNLPIATGYESIDNSDSLLIDGTWWKAGSNGELFALDDTDLVWYEVDIIDEDPDIVIYYMDIRSQLLAGV
tara:strand:- start:49 stop:411 length:363 start_codon:yes stop_codon:yes gene_type:complete